MNSQKKEELMNLKKTLLFSAVILSMSIQTQAKDPNKNDPALTIPECKTIEDACLGVGFVAGEWEQDNGLWKQCVKPIAKGQDLVRSKDGKELKSTPELATAAKSCLEKKPKHPKKVAK
jgi:hypothetical protein